MCIKSLNEKGISFKCLEKKIYKYTCDIACELMKNVLETLDEKLMSERDCKKYRNKGLRKTCVKTIMGNVEYSRRVYQFKLENGKKANKFLLDEYLNMDIIGNISMNLTESILNNITEVSYRKTADNIETMCNQNISAQSVWNVVQTIGKGISKLEDRKIELDEQGGLNGDKEVPVLFQEQDGVKPSYKVVGKTLCASFKSVNHFKKLCNVAIDELYNTDEIEARILNGDGAGWIRKSCEDNNIHFQLDPFHVSQAIIRNVADKRKRKKLMKLFKNGDADKGLEYLTQMLIEADEESKDFEKLSNLYNYLSTNKDGLIPYKKRENINLPTAPEGIEYRQMGTMESNIFNVLAKRMKGKKMSWSIKGADNLAKILAEYKSNRLYETVDKIYNNIIPESVLEDVVKNIPLSAKKVCKDTESSNIYAIKTAEIPYSSAAVTLGRKVIRDLCGLKDFGELSYT